MTQETANWERRRREQLIRSIPAKKRREMKELAEKSGEQTMEAFDDQLKEIMAKAFNSEKTRR